MPSITGRHKKGHNRSRDTRQADAKKKLDKRISELQQNHVYPLYVEAVTPAKKRQAVGWIKKGLEDSIEKLKAMDQAEEHWKEVWAERDKKAKEKENIEGANSKIPGKKAGNTPGVAINVVDTDKVRDAERERRALDQELRTAVGKHDEREYAYIDSLTELRHEFGKAVSMANNNFGAEGRPNRKQKDGNRAFTEFCSGLAYFINQNPDALGELIVVQGIVERADKALEDLKGIYDLAAAEKVKRDLQNVRDTINRSLGGSEGKTDLEIKQVAESANEKLEAIRKDVKKIAAAQVEKKKDNDAKKRLDDLMRDTKQRLGSPKKKNRSSRIRESISGICTPQ